MLTGLEPGVQSSSACVPFLCLPDYRGAYSGGAGESILQHLTPKASFFHYVIARYQRKDAGCQMEKKAK
jgi:hypothetical protein